MVGMNSLAEIVGCHRNTLSRKVREGTLTLKELNRIVQTLGLSEEEIIRIVKGDLKCLRTER